MGRAVGGSSAVGCGILGLGGLVVGIGLTVWLGSQVLTSTAGDGDRTERTDVSTLSSDLAERLPTPQVTPGTAVLRIAAPPDLADRGEVTVSGDGFAAGPVELTTCLATTPPGGGERCDPASQVRATADADGAVEQAYPVARILAIGARAYDCAARPGACAVQARSPGQPDAPAAQAALVFAGGLPPVDAEAPPAP